MKEKISELVQANRNNYGLIAGVVAGMVDYMTKTELIN